MTTDIERELRRKVYFLVRELDALYGGCDLADARMLARDMLRDHGFDLWKLSTMLEGLVYQQLLLRNAPKPTKVLIPMTIHTNYQPIGSFDHSRNHKTS